MRIKSVSSTGFYGRSFHHILQPITIIHGENGVGKTSVLTALRLGFMGHDPRLPKRKADIFDALASSKTLNITILFDNGQTNVVNYMLRGSTVTGTPEINVEVPSVMLDLDEFFEQSKQSRIQWLLQRCISKEDQATLAQLDEKIAKNEAAAKDGEYRRKTLQASIAAATGAVVDVAQKPPEDLAGKIQKIEAELGLDQQQIRNLYAELSSKESADKRLLDLVSARDKAVSETEAPICESCGRVVNSLRSSVYESFQEGILFAENMTRQCRSREEIVADGKAIRAVVTEKEAVLAGMRSLQGRWNQFVGRESEIHRQRKSLTDTEQQLETEKAMGKELVAQRLTMLQKSVDPLISRASLFTRPIAGIELKWIDGEIGYFPEGSSKMVPFAVFSGREQIAAVCGLGWAFSERTPIHLVVIDEMGVLSKTSKAKVMGTMEELIKQGLVDQFIGIDVSGEDYDLEKGGLIHVE